MLAVLPFQISLVILKENISLTADGANDIHSWAGCTQNSWGHRANLGDGIQH